MKKRNRLFLLTLLLIVFLAGGLLCILKTYIPNASVASLFNNSFPFSPQSLSPKQVPQKIQHVFVIVEENHDWQSIYNNPDAPFINNTLLTQGSYAGNYHNVPISQGELHPSELNYISLEAGTTTFPDTTFSTDDNPSTDNSTKSVDHLVSILGKKGYTWKSYQEDITGNDCPIDTVDNYAPRHNPFIYFQDVSGNPPDSTNTYCRDHIRPLSELQTDLASGNIPNYVFITPNLQNDMHNGSIADADTWLSHIIPLITSSSTFRKDGALFITWDEGSEENGGNHPIGMIIESPFSKKDYTNTQEYSHASLLKTIEEIFHIAPLLGATNDSQTKDLFDFFK